MLTLLGSLAVVLPIGLQQGVAQAASGPQVIIQQDASYILAGGTIDVGLNVRCQGGSGSGQVVVNVTQSSPPSPVAGGAAGSGTSSVVCDGRTHPVALTVFGFDFGAGQAWATADLDIGTQTGVAHAQRWITIVVD